MTLSQNSSRVREFETVMRPNSVRGQPTRGLVVRLQFLAVPSSSRNSPELSRWSTVSAAPWTKSDIRRAPSQTLAAPYPLDARLCLTSSSRCMLAANCFIQKLVQVEGPITYRRPLWQCQNQPLAKMSASNFGKTRSGRRQMSTAWRRNRRRQACRAFHSVVSSLVCLPLIPTIMCKRVSWSTISVTTLLAPLSCLLYTQVQGFSWSSLCLPCSA